MAGIAQPILVDNQPLNQPLVQPAAVAALQAPVQGGRGLAELMAVTAAIAAGAIYYPPFAFGLTIGACQLVCILPIAVLVSIFLANPPDNNRPREEVPVWAVSLGMPIGEELVFRGFLQPNLESALTSFLPAMGYEILGAQMALATIVAIVATGLIFGLLHSTNAHENVHIQVFITTYAGLLLGFLASRYGLLASIGTHVANNHFVSCLMVAKSYLSPDQNPGAQP